MKQVRIYAAATVMVAAACLLLRMPPPAGAASTPPSGSVVGVSSPATGTLELLLYATDASGTGLASAEASLDDIPFASVPLSGTSVSAVPLMVDTGSIGDGYHQLKVVVTDAVGDTALVLDRSIAVQNTFPATGPIATLQVGIAGGEPDSSTSPPPSGHPGCGRPRLHLRLGRKPLWFTHRHHVPVLEHGSPYPFHGRLTCRGADGKRVPAAPGSQVRIYYRVWARSFERFRGPVKFISLRTVETDESGRFAVNLGFRSGRSVLFRYRGAEGEVANTLLRLAVRPAPQGFARESR